MISSKPFGEPVETIRELLGGSYEREYPGLSDLCGLIRANRPSKIVKIGGTNSSATAAILRCIDILKIPCQLYVIDPLPEVFPYTRDIFDLERELEEYPIEACHLFQGHTPAAYLEEIGGGIDFLILDAVEMIPGNILDFIVTIPYLTRNAIVVLCEMRTGTNRNVLFQAVAADKPISQLDLCLNALNPIRFAGTETISVFQLNADTFQYLPDLFALLKCSWNYIPKLDHLLEYDMSIGSYYEPMCLKLYREAVLEADPYKEMLRTMAQSMLKPFSQILLFGKGLRGRYFLKMAQWIGIPVTGFVVSDGRASEKEYKNLPVYHFSQIPFGRDEVFIFRTAVQKEVQQQLEQSDFRWTDLPVNFWRECEHEEYLSGLREYFKKMNYPNASKRKTLWSFST